MLIVKFVYDVNISLRSCSYIAMIHIVPKPQTIPRNCRKHWYSIQPSFPCVDVNSGILK